MGINWQSEDVVSISDPVIGSRLWLALMVYFCYPPTLAALFIANKLIFTAMFCLWLLLVTATFSETLAVFDFKSKKILRKGRFWPFQCEYPINLESFPILESSCIDYTYPMLDISNEYLCLNADKKRSELIPLSNYGGIIFFLEDLTPIREKLDKTFKIQKGE